MTQSGHPPLAKSSRFYFIGAWHREQSRSLLSRRWIGSARLVPQQ